MQLPMTIVLRPSLTLALLLTAAHGLVIATVMLVVLSLWIKLGLLLAILASALHIFLSLRGPQVVLGLSLRADGLFEVSRADGTSTEMRVHPHTTVMPGLVVLLMRENGTRIQSLVLFPDAISTGDMRQLRLWLRWLAETAEPVSLPGNSC